MTKLQRALYFKERQEREQLARKVVWNQITLATNLLSHLIGFKVLQEHISICNYIIANPVCLVLTTAKGQSSLIKAILKSTSIIGCYYFYSDYGSYVGQSINLNKRVSAHMLGHVKNTIGLVNHTFNTSFINLHLYSLPKNIDLQDITQKEFLFILEFMLFYKHVPTVNINYLPSPGISPAQSTLEKLRTRTGPVYVYSLLIETETLIQVYTSLEVIGPTLGKSTRWGAWVKDNMQGVYKNILLISRIKLNNRPESIIIYSDICTLINSTIPATAVKSTTNTHVEVINLVSGEKHFLSVIDTVLQFDVSVISIISGNANNVMYNGIGNTGEKYKLLLVPVKPVKLPGPLNMVQVSEVSKVAVKSGSNLYIYQNIDNELTLIYIFEKINLIGPALGFHKRYASRILADHKGWYRNVLYITKKPLNAAPVNLVTLYTLQKIMVDNYKFS